MTTLKQYLKSQPRGGLSRLAESLDTSKGYILDIVNKRRRPSVEMAQKIERETGISAIALLGLRERA